MIIVDDGSDDDTEKVVCNFNDPRIRYFKQNNRGIWKLHETYNFALDNTHGKYIAIIEGDDLWPPDKLSRQVSTLDNSDAVLSFGKFRRINQNGIFLEPDVYKPSNS